MSDLLLGLGRKFWEEEDLKAGDVRGAEKSLRGQMPRGGRGPAGQQDHLHPRRLRAYTGALPIPAARGRSPSRRGAGREEGSARRVRRAGRPRSSAPGRARSLGRRDAAARAAGAVQLLRG